VTAAALTLARTRYDGFRATLKAVGSGRRGCRALALEEGREAARALLAGDATDAQAGAFLVAMRVKGEEPAELAGIALALRDAARTRGDGGDPRAPLVACAGGYDGVLEHPQLGLAASVLAAAAGVRCVVHCGATLGPKRGTTPADVLAALGGPPRPSVAASRAMLERAGVCVVHAGEAIPGWDRLAVLRDEIGLRGPLHSAEKLVDHFGARRFVVGHAHAPYGPRLLETLALLGAERAVAVRGFEGADVVRPGRPSAADAAGPVELPALRGGAELPAGHAGAAGSAALTRAVLERTEGGPAARAVVLGAALRLHAGGAVADVGDAVRRAEAALHAGRAAERLDALLG